MCEYNCNIYLWDCFVCVCIVFSLIVTNKFSAQMLWQTDTNILYTNTRKLRVRNRERERRREFGAAQGAPERERVESVQDYTTFDVLVLINANRIMPTSVALRQQIGGCVWGLVALLHQLQSAPTYVQVYVCECVRL